MVGVAVLSALRACCIFLVVPRFIARTTTVCSCYASCGVGKPCSLFSRVLFFGKPKASRQVLFHIITILDCVHNQYSAPHLCCRRVCATCAEQSVCFDRRHVRFRFVGVRRRHYGHKPTGCEYVTLHPVSSPLCKAIFVNKLWSTVTYPNPRRQMSQTPRKQKIFKSVRAFLDNSRYLVLLLSICSVPQAPQRTQQHAAATRIRARWHSFQPFFV